jgi:hypothetical protein
MKIQIDLKSAVCGLIIGVAAMFALGADSSSNQAGKYQVTVGANDVYVLDTQTGEVWAHEPTTDGEGGNRASKFWDTK